MKIKFLALSLLACTNVWATEILSPGVTLLEHTESHGERLPQQLIDMPPTTSANVENTFHYKNSDKAKETPKQ